MRDLQSTFWDGRTRRERILQIRQEKCQIFDEMKPLYSNRLGYRFSIIPQNSQHIPSVYGAIKNQQIQLGRLGNVEVALASKPNNPHQWKPDVVGARSIYDEQNSYRNFHEVWEIDENGTASVFGFVSDSLGDEKRESRSIYFHWLRGTVLCLILINREISKHLQSQGETWEFDAELFIPSSGLIVKFGDKSSGSSSHLSPGKFRTRPALVRHDSDINNYINLIEEKLLNICKRSLSESSSELLDMFNKHITH